MMFRRVNERQYPCSDIGKWSPERPSPHVDLYFPERAAKEKSKEIDRLTREQKAEERQKQRGKEYDVEAGIEIPEEGESMKNKVESMKKRYRAETAAVARASPAAAGLSWRFFARMDGLLKGPPVGPDQVQQQPKLTNGRIDLQAPAKPEAEEEADFAAQLQDAVPGAFTDLMKWTRMAPSRIKRRRLITACRRRAGLLIAMPTSVLRG
ncbi:hypothetical protein ACJX0J_014498, partial [Zea mays]